MASLNSWCLLNSAWMESTLTRKQIAVIVAGTQSTRSTLYTSIGAFAFNPADFDSPMEPSTIRQIRFRVTLELETTSGLTGLVRLFNRNAVPPNTVTGSEMGTKSSISDILTSPVLTLPDSTTIYEVQIRLGGSGIPGPNDRVTCKLAQLEISDLTSTVISVDNIDELRSITKLEGIVNVKGFSSIGDGGDGNFIWDQYSPAEDNNGTIIRPNKQPPDTDGRWIRQFSEDINVRWFGAKGDTKGIAGELKGTVSVSGTTGTLKAKDPVFGPKDSGKIIMIWDSIGIEKPLVIPNKPYFTTIDHYVDDFAVEFTVEPQDPPTRVIDNMCFAWGTDDTKAIQDAWDATKGIYRLIFPNGTYCVTTLTRGVELGSLHILPMDGTMTTTLTSGTMPSAYLEGIGKVIIVSPNSLGVSDVDKPLSTINQIIKFTESCGRASITNIIFQGISTSDAGIIKYSDSKPETLPLPSPFNVTGENGPFNHRVGIYYHGTDAIICNNVEVSNMPCAGLLIDKGTGQSLIEDSYFHANGLFNIKAYPGERVPLKAGNSTYPEIRYVTRVTQSGSIKLSHTRIEDSIPVAYGYNSYGIDMGGCEFTAIDCDFVNNAVNGIGNNDANPSNMTFDNCRFAFGKNNGKLLFPQFFNHASVTEDSNIVNIDPIPSFFSIQSSPGIKIPGVCWSLVDDPGDPQHPRVFPYGTGSPNQPPPRITITGKANQTVILKIICTSPGTLGDWKFIYSTDNGNNYTKKEITSKSEFPLNSSVDSSDTGLIGHIDADIPGTTKRKATVGDLWLADNTYTYPDPNFPLKPGVSTITTKQKADTSSTGDNALTWVEIVASSLLNVDATCQNFSCTNCLFKGTDSTTRGLSAVLLKGHTFDPISYDPSDYVPLDQRRIIESQRVVKIIGNTFDTFNVEAIIYSRPWTTKEIKIQNNVFIDSPFSQCICHDPQQFDSEPDPTDPTKKKTRLLPFNKKAISKIIHLSGNTYVDVGRVYLDSGGLIEINDERVIYTGKSYHPIPYIWPIPPIPPIPPSPPNPTIPTAQHVPSTQHFVISTRLGRVGRVIRRNNTISGQIASKLYDPSTSFAIKLYSPSTLAPEDPSPKWWSWHEGDREEINLVGITYYPYYGFLGSTSDVPGKETELTVTKFWSSAPDGITDQFQAGREISMLYWDSGESKHKNVTWGGGFPNVALAAVDRTAGVGKVCAKTALSADIDMTAAVSAPSSYGFNGSTLADSKEITVATLLPGGFTDQFQAGREISMPGVTWGSGFPNVALEYVNRSADVRKVCAKTALPADNPVTNAAVSAPSSYGFNGSTSLFSNKLTVATLLPGGFTNQFQAGREISMRYLDPADKVVKNVTWGGGFPNVKLAAVDRTADVGKVCAKTALPADNYVPSAYVWPSPTLFSYGARICIEPGTFGKCTARATTTRGNYRIDVDDVTTLCPQQRISIDKGGRKKVTFESPNAVAKYTESTEIVDVIGLEGRSGYIIVREAPDDKVTNAEISFVLPKLVLYEKTAST
jgi:hypothetical protein